MNSKFNYASISSSLSVIGTYKSGKTLFSKELISQGFKYLSYNLLDSNINIPIPTEFQLVLKTSKESIIIQNIINVINSGSKKIVFDEVLDYVNSNLKKVHFEYLNTENVIFVNVTSNIEDVLFANYLIVLNNNNIAIEGNTLAVLQEEKILKRLGFNLPFFIDISIQLKYYGLVDKIYLTKEDLVSKLWK